MANLITGAYEGYVLLYKLYRDYRKIKNRYYRIYENFGKRPVVKEVKRDLPPIQKDEKTPTEVEYIKCRKDLRPCFTKGKVYKVSKHVDHGSGYSQFIYFNDDKGFAQCRTWRDKYGNNPYPEWELATKEEWTAQERPPRLLIDALVSKGVIRKDDSDVIKNITREDCNQFIRDRVEIEEAYQRTKDAYYNLNRQDSQRMCSAGKSAEEHRKKMQALTSAMRTMHTVATRISYM